MRRSPDLLEQVLLVVARIDEGFGEVHLGDLFGLWVYRLLADAVRDAGLDAVVADPHGPVRVDLGVLPVVYDEANGCGSVYVCFHGGVADPGQAVEVGHGTPRGDAL